MSVPDPIDLEAAGREVRRLLAVRNRCLAQQQAARLMIGATVRLWRFDLKCRSERFPVTLYASIAARANLSVSALRAAEGKAARFYAAHPELYDLPTEAALERIVEILMEKPKGKAA